MKKHQKIVAYTCYPFIDIQEKYIDAGFNGYLRKPINQELSIEDKEFLRNRGDSIHIAYVENIDSVEFSSDEYKNKFLDTAKYLRDFKGSFLIGSDSNIFWQIITAVISINCNSRSR
jgi:hypothetical protein